MGKKLLESCALQLQKKQSALRSSSQSIARLRILQDVLQPQSEFWTKTTQDNIPDAKVPWKTKEDIVQAFLLNKKCKEEMDMLRADMLETIPYWMKRTENITNELSNFEGPKIDIFGRGMKSILNQLLCEAKLRHSQAVAKFSN